MTHEATIGTTDRAGAGVNGLRLFIQVVTPQPNGRVECSADIHRDGDDTIVTHFWVHLDEHGHKTGLYTEISCPFGNSISDTYTDPTTGKVYVIERVDVRKLETLTDDEAQQYNPAYATVHHCTPAWWACFNVEVRNNVKAHANPWCWFAWAREVSQ